MEGTPLVELKEISRSYQAGDDEIQVLKPTSFKIYAGEFVAIIGRSGSGKSTLLNILGCLDKPSGGQYLFEGKDIAGFSKDELSTLRSETFGFIFQRYNLIPSLTSTENVEVPAAYLGMDKKERNVRAQELLAKLNLSHRLNNLPNKMSGGEQQRVSIARALMNGGRIIIADEPTGALDSKSGDEVMEMLKELNRAGHTIIMVTHNPELAEQAERVISITDGVVQSDTGTKLATNKVQEKATVNPKEWLENLKESISFAFRSLLSNKFRTLLTLLGIIIGVGSVITMMAFGEGASQSIIANIEKMGSNLLYVNPGAPNVRRGGSIQTLVKEDVEEIAAVVPGLKAVVGEVTGSVTARYGSVDYRTTVRSTMHNYLDTTDMTVELGSFFSRRDNRAMAQVAIIGRTVEKELFANSGGEALGKNIMLNNMPFQIIGIFKEMGSGMGGDQDDVIVIPLDTGMNKLFGQKHLRAVTIAVADKDRMFEVEENVKKILLERHKTEDFRIRNMASLIETISETSQQMTLLLAAIAAISLLVGGIGVMNIMLVNVTERTKEIGIRMAVGAKVRDIMMQFMTEAVVICFAGGLLGILLGVGAGMLLKVLGQSIAFSAGPVIISFASAAAIGLIFGYLPAKKAANLDPIVALSDE